MPVVVGAGLNVVVVVEVVVLRQLPEGGVFQTRLLFSSGPAIHTHSPAQSDGGAVVLAVAVVLEVELTADSMAIGSLDQSPSLF